MCETCGCQGTLVTVMREARSLVRRPLPSGTRAYGLRRDESGLSRFLRLGRDILARHVAGKRRYCKRHGIFALNLFSSPGAGKTTRLCRSLARLPKKLPVSVIEGDQQTPRDAEWVRAAGVAVDRIDTGKGCHLDAHLQRHAIDDPETADDASLSIENVGNSVCPAAFDLGEAHKVMILSVVEGAGKPLQYPHIFRASFLLLINGIDLLLDVAFACQQTIAYARRVNPQRQAINISAISAAGINAWATLLQTGCTGQQSSKASTVITVDRHVTGIESSFSVHSRDINV